MTTSTLGKALEQARASEAGIPFDIGPFKAIKHGGQAQIVNETPDKVVLDITWPETYHSAAGLNSKVRQLAARQNLKVTGSSKWINRGTGPSKYRWTLRRA
jgi:hypothetical protein